jgi:hypothetical protein
VDESLARQSRLPLPGAAGGAQPAGLDDLPLDGKTPPFTQPAQAPHDFVVADLLGGTTVFADHELALMRMLDIAAGDKRVGGFDLMNELVGDQKIERAVDRRRAELAALLLELCQQCVGSLRLVGWRIGSQNMPRSGVSRAPRSPQIRCASAPNSIC